MRGLSLLVNVLTCIVAVAHAYTDPILPGFNRDPSIIRDGEDYRLVVSSFECFPSTFRDCQFPTPQIWLIGHFTAML